MTKATNQAAELFAVLALLRSVPQGHDLLIRADSQYTINVCTKWIKNWRSNGWKRADGAPIINSDIIKDLDRALTRRTGKTSFEWVKGHAGNIMNAHADARCTAASHAIKRGTPIPVGPGWADGPTGVIPATVNRSMVTREARAAREAALPAPVASRRAPTKVSRHFAAPRAEGAVDRSTDWDADLTVKKPTAARTPVKCTACGYPIHPLTLECKCSV